MTLGGCYKDIFVFFITISILGLLPHPYPYTRKEHNDPNQVYEIKVDKATMEHRPSWFKD